MILRSYFLPTKSSAIVISLFTIASIIQYGASEETFQSPSLLQKFWDIGCEFSGVVTRVRRSAPQNPNTEEPDFNDPEELFKYLYPLADVKPGEDSTGESGSQRSNLGTHTLSSWLEDLLELWHSECHHRRNKRSSRRMSEYNREASTEPRRRFHGMFGSRNKQKSDGERKNSTLEMFSRRKDAERNEDVDSDEGYTYVLPEQTEGNGDNRTDAVNAILRGEVAEDLLEELGKKLKPDKDKDKGNGNNTNGNGSGTPEEVPVVEEEKQDIFFSQYGGDIEYFFPLLSFGIPFDGEITLLGFHGFRGIFPY